MIRIVRIQRAKRSTRFDVYTNADDEQPDFTVKESFLSENGIAVGAEYTEEEFDVLRARAQLTEAIRIAMDALERKDYSRKELTRKITDRNLPPDVAETAVDYVAERGYQSDLRYARRLAEIASANYGRTRVKSYLIAHGIDRETAESVLEERFDADKEADKIDRAIAKAARGVDLSIPQNRNKIYAKLARLGYDSSSISAAFSRYRNEREDDPA